MLSHDSTQIKSLSSQSNNVVELFFPVNYHVGCAFHKLNNNTNFHIIIIQAHLRYVCKQKIYIAELQQFGCSQLCWMKENALLL